jgi:DNA-directed RNA polymerase sigma subunit (sigma70/sigma32)
MRSGLEQNLIKISNTAALIAVNLAKGKSIEEIANKLQVSQKEVIEIQKILKVAEETSRLQIGCVDNDEQKKKLSNAVFKTESTATIIDNLK